MFHLVNSTNVIEKPLTQIRAKLKQALFVYMGSLPLRRSSRVNPWYGEYRFYSSGVRDLAGYSQTL